MKILKMASLNSKESFYSTLSEEEIFKLLKKSSSNQREITEYLLASNIDYIIAIARKYSDNGICVDDLVSEGCIGFMKAIEKFDTQKNCILKTYATFWIKQQITRAIDNYGRMIRVPSTSSSRIKQYKRISAELTNELKRVPTTQEIADKMGVNETILMRLMNAESKTTSIEEVLPNTDNKSLGSISLIDNNAPDFNLAVKDSHIFLAKQIKSLGTRAAEIIQMRFGLNQKEPQTLDYVSQSIGLSIERTRQIEISSIKKLKILLSGNISNIGIAV